MYSLVESRNVTRYRYVHLAFNTKPISDFLMKHSISDFAYRIWNKSGFDYGFD